MRYHYEKPKRYVSQYGETYICDHRVYNRCTLFLLRDKGLAIIQQRFNEVDKTTYWTEIDPWLTDAIYTHPRFLELFESRADYSNNDIFPTITVRQVMWKLKMKPLPKERWETVFDRSNI